MKTKNYILRLLIGGIFAFTPAIAQQVLSNNSGLSVYAAGINLRGDVIGTISDSAGQTSYGFYYQNNNLSASVAPFSSFCQPGACALPSQVVPRAINNNGLIVGNGAPVAGSSYIKGWFCTAPCSSYTVIDVPGATNVWVSSVSSTGVIAGAWDDANNVPHAFFRDERGRITKFDAPNLSRSNPTYLTPGIVVNGNGDMAGHFVDSLNVAHIFYRTAKGQVSTFDIAGSQGLGVNALNNSGIIAGNYVGADGRARGFMLSVGGRKPSLALTSCDFPAAVYGTTLSAINNNGIAIGYYFDASFGYHPIRCNPNGATSSLDYGPAGTTTILGAINDNNTIAFAYVNGPLETTTAQTYILTLP